MTQLEQINNVINNLYLVTGTLGATAGKIKNLERDHYSAGELENIHSALLAAVAKFRGGVFFERENADRAIANRFDRCMVEVIVSTPIEQSQLAQIDSLMTDAKAVNKRLKQLTLDIEQLKAEHPQTQGIDARYWAVKDALKEYRRIMAPLRALRKDATFTNGVTAADGFKGLQKAFDHLDSATTPTKPRRAIDEV